MASDPNAKIRLDPVEATQATRRPRLIYVLVGGVALVIVAFVVVWLATTK